MQAAAERGELLHARDHQAVAEGLNSKIMSIKRRVGGYRNRDYQTAILSTAEASASTHNKPDSGFRP